MLTSINVRIKIIVIIIYDRESLLGQEQYHYRRLVVPVHDTITELLKKYCPPRK